MKKISLIALVSISLITFSCKEKATEKIENANVEAAAVRDASANKMAVMSFDKTFHDFGQITQGTPPTNGIYFYQYWRRSINYYRRYF